MNFTWSDEVQSHERQQLLGQDGVELWDCTTNASHR